MDKVQVFASVSQCPFSMIDEKSPRDNPIVSVLYENLIS